MQKEALKLVDVGDGASVCNCVRLVNVISHLTHYLFKYALDSNTIHPSFNPTGVRTHVVRS